MIDLKREDLFRFLQEKLNLSNKAQLSMLSARSIKDNYSIADANITDGVRRIHLIFKYRATLNDLSKMNLLKSLTSLDKNDDFLDEYVILSTRTDPQITEYSQRLAILTIGIPSEILPREYYRQNVKTVKMSLSRSFHVIYKFLQLSPSTISEVSDQSGVSYGWTHAVINRLIEIGIAERRTGYYSIKNVNALLDLLAYERPIRSLVYRELMVNSVDAMHLANEISRFAEVESIDLAFTGITSSSMYDKFNIRRDSAYLYVRREDIGHFLELIGKEKKGNVKLTVLLPDRDIFSNTSVLNGIRVVSAEQTLLDLASMGIQAREVAVRMVDYIASRKN